MSIQIADLNETIQNQLKLMKSDDRLTILNISNNGTINLSDLAYYRSNNHIIVFINPTDQEITTVETLSKPEVRHASRVKKQVELFTHLSANPDPKPKCTSPSTPKANHRFSVKKVPIKDNFMNECLPTLTKVVGKQLKTVYTSTDGFDPLKMHQAIDKQPCEHTIFLKLKKKMPSLKIGKDLVDTNCAYTATLNGMISVNACMDRYYSDMNILPTELIGSIYPNKENIEYFAVYYKVTGYDGKDYGCVEVTRDETVSNKNIYKAFEPVDGVCLNPFILIESSSSETNQESSSIPSTSSSETNQESSSIPSTSSSETNQESSSTPNTSSSEINQDNNNNDEDKGAKILVVGVMLICLFLI
ncbi:TLDc domain-containing protein [Entamoeba marina]